MAVAFASRSTSTPKRENCGPVGITERACCIYIALRWGFGLASVPFLVIFASGYFYVGINSIHVLWKMSRDVEEVAAVAEPVST